MYRKAINNEKGVALILIAVAIVVLFGFGALAIDVGHLYNVKNQLQAAADAAALAGAAEMSGANLEDMATNAYNGAFRLGMRNYADVAAQDTANAPAGRPIPVWLNGPNTGNDPNGDVVLGVWSGNTFTVSSDTAQINAVKVVARRTSDVPSSAQPKVNNWFAKVFSLLGARFDLSSIQATAIAAKGGNVPLVPIAVNEYWEEGSGGPNLYGQVYPKSFMRAKNIDGVTNGLAGTIHNIFAVLGADAGSNQPGLDQNGFVSVLYRNEYHDPKSNFWYNTPTTSGTCSACPMAKGPDVGNSLNNNKWNQALDWGYLFAGIPSNVIPPNAVVEALRVPASTYPANNYTNPVNDPSNCPFATVPYYKGSGNDISVEKYDYNGSMISFLEKWPKGSRLLVMVYDGTHANTDKNQADAVTVIGYGVIEIDGYDQNWNGTRALDAGGIGTGSHGNTAYGHAVPHNVPSGDDGVVDSTDPYILQPSKLTPSLGIPDCAFVTRILQIQQSLSVTGKPRLVGPGGNQHIGMAPQQNN